MKLAAGVHETSFSRTRTPWLSAYRPLLLFGFAATIACFTIATNVVWHAYRATAAHFKDVSDNALPSVVALADIRTSVHDIERTVGRAKAGEPAALSFVGERLDRIAKVSAAYNSYPAFPGEQRVWVEFVAPPLADFRREALAVSLGEHLGTATNDDLRHEQDVLAAAVRLDAGLGELIALNGREGKLAAARVENFRVRYQAVTFGLQALCLVISITVAAVVYAAVRRFSQLAEERASELEQFASRVAHDVRGPLSPVLMSLQMASKANVDDKTRKVLERGLKSAHLVGEIVQGLFEFASGGARPVPGITSSVRRVLDDVLLEVEPVAAATQTSVSVEPFDDPRVACAQGILASMLSNLIRNAIKFMGPRPERHVYVRVEVRGQRVRVEVEDTGPGLTPGSEKSLFQAYVRGTAVTAKGLGLGLATVKRFAESHGGRVGVRHTPDVGSTFWFELPEGSRSAFASRG